MNINFWHHTGFNSVELVGATHDPSSRILWVPYTELQRALKVFRREDLDKIIVDYAWESGLGSGIYNTLAEKIENSLGIPAHRQLWILNISHEQLVKSRAPMHLFNYFAVSATKLADRTPSSTLLKDRPQQLLCMTGKVSSKPIRLELLWELYNSPLWEYTILSTLETSYNPRIEHKYGKKFAKQMMKAKSLNLEPKKHDTFGGTSMGYPAPAEYDTTRASLVLETHTTQNHGVKNFATEKIYRPIVMGHPFVVQGVPGQIENLEKLGFDMFRNVIQHAYDCEKETSPKLVMQEMHTLFINAGKTQDSVNHNRNHLFDLARQETQSLRERLERFINF